MTMFKNEPPPADRATVPEQEADARCKALMLMETEYLHVVALMRSWLQAHKPPEEEPARPKVHRRKR